MWFREGRIPGQRHLHCRVSIGISVPGAAKTNDSSHRGGFTKAHLRQRPLRRSQAASTGIRFDIDSRAAFSHFSSPTAASQDVGFRIHDTAAEGLGSGRHGTLHLGRRTSTGFDQEAVLVNRWDECSCKGNLRSVESFAARLSGFGSIEWVSANIYGGHLGGILLEGGFNDFALKPVARHQGMDPSRVAASASR